MQNQFSPALILKCKKLVFKRAGVKISDDDAERCLDRLARLAALAVKTLGKKKTNTNPDEENNSN